MDFNFDDILKSAGVPAPRPKATFPVKVVTMPKQEIVRTVNEPKPNGAPLVPAKPAIELCACGHPEDAHAEGGECEILECECLSWCPPSHIYDINQVSPEGTTPQAKVEEAAPVAAPPPPSPSLGELLETFDERHPSEPKPIEPEVEALPTPDVENNFPDDYCAHLCDNPDCVKWWTHGPKCDCKYPDVLKQGLCQLCNTNGETFQIEPEKDIKDGKLTAPAQIKARNDERIICKNMNIEQLTRHIEYHALRIEELRIRSLEARKMRAELEEEELANIPEHEREAFIQALRRGEQEGKTKKVRSARKPKDPAMMTPKAKETALVAQLKATGKSGEEARVIAAMMLKTGKTQEQVEAWLND